MPFPIFKTHKEKEKYVVDRILEFVPEFRQLFIQNKGKEVIPQRLQLIGAFTMIDVFASYWFEYLGKNGKPSERFYAYVNQFCLNSKNSSFAKTDFLKYLTSETFYEFRNSLVHFYGLGRLDFMIAADPSTIYSESKINEIVNRVRKKQPKLVIIQPRHIREIVIESAALMFESMIDVIHKSHVDVAAKDAHIAGIERIFIKLMKEGAVGVR